MIKRSLFLLLLTLASSAQAISFKHYYRAHKAEVDKQVADHRLDLGNKGLTDLDGLDEERVPGLNGIRVLNLSQNNLGALASDIFHGFTDLESLFLYLIQLTEVPKGLFDRLSKLRMLTLDGNPLTTLPEGVFSELKALRVLDLGYNKLSALPENIFKQTSDLVMLDLSSNLFTTMPAHIFDDVTKLEDLDLSGNLLATLPPDIFHKLTHLEKLKLYNNLIPLNTEQLKKELQLPDSVNLLFKTPAQEKTEQELFEAIKAGDEDAVRTIYKTILMGELRATDWSRIDATKIRDAAGNDPLHAIINALDRKKQSINSSDDTAIGKERQIREASERWTRIFGYLTQFGGPKVQQMLLVRNKNGDDVLASAVGLLGRDNPLVKALLQKPSAPRFKITPRPAVAPSPQEQQKVDEIALLEKSEKEGKEVQEAAENNVGKMGRVRALAVLGLRPDQDDPDVIQNAFIKLSARYNPEQVAAPATGFRSLMEDKQAAFIRAWEYLSASQNKKP